jgi:hypothetical protein
VAIAVAGGTRIIAAAVVVAAVAAAALAQRGGFGGGGRDRRFAEFQTPPNVPYDGRFAFVRVKYETAPGGYWWRGQPA